MTVESMVDAVEASAQAREPLLAIDRLDVAYDVTDGVLEALHDVSFTVARGEVVGIVGESGCGKSTLSAALMRLLATNGRVRSGSMVFDGRDLLALSQDEMRSVRGDRIAMISQDPLAAFNPVFTVGTQMVDAQRAHLRRHGIGRRGRALAPRGPIGGLLAKPASSAAATVERKQEQVLKERAIRALEQVGIPDARERIDNYPHEFSGGQRQRIMIAIAILLKPALLIADEPTSSLDVTLEAQILELLRQLRAEHETSILFISHDLGVISQIADRVIVMYAGRVVEYGGVKDLFDSPTHPYTRALLASIPSRHRRGERLAGIPGRVPSLATMPAGCAFAPRCRYAHQEICTNAEPQIYVREQQGVRCFMHDPSQADHWTEAERKLAPESAQPEQLRGEVPIEGRHGRSDDESDLVTISGVKTYFGTSIGPLQRILAREETRAIRAVDDVSLTIQRGEVIGLVGESGSGKSTLGRTILRLADASAGRVDFDGLDVLAAGKRELRNLRRQAQMIFQEPQTSLSPRMRVAELLAEPYLVNEVPKSERLSVAQLLDLVGLAPEQARKYPHQLSGGQARRVGIARALALQPSFIVADEPTSGLDVSAAASILNLMTDLATRLDLTYLLITHNLNIVGYIADRIAVMYLGHLVEIGSTDDIFEHPKHPYTRALLASISEPNPRARRDGHRVLAPGEIPSPRNPPSGCRFRTRCAYATERSSLDVPELQEVAPGHAVACHNWQAVESAANRRYADGEDRK